MDAPAYSFLLLVLGLFAGVLVTLVYFMWRRPDMDREARGSHEALGSQPASPPVMSASAADRPAVGAEAVYPAELALEGTDDAPLYGVKAGLLTYQERRFFEALRVAVADTYDVFAMVRMDDVLYLRNEPQNPKYHRNQIQCKHFDFLLCDPQERRLPVMAIELDDSSHKQPYREASDAFKVAACQSAELPLLRIPVQADYAPNELREQIRQALR